MLERFTYGQRLCAVEHVTIAGKEHINGLLLSKKKKELLVDRAFEEYEFEKLSNHIPPKQHLFLIINSSNVLFRQLNGVLEPKRALQQAFPNLKIDDFYYEIYLSKASTLVAICRKATIQKLLGKYASMNFNVIGFSLGNMSVTHLENFLDKRQIATSNALVKFEDQKVSYVTLNQLLKKDYIINGLELNNDLTLPLSGILNYYLKTSKTVSNFDAKIEELRENHKQQHLFNLGLKISLATIFVLLLFSFLLFSNYTTKITHLNTTLSLNQSQKASLIKLSNEVEKKEKLIEDFSLASSKASWYLDQLGATVPETITLSELQWQPLNKAIKNEQPIELSQRSLIVKGISNKGEGFSGWLSTLEGSEWVAQVAIHEYGLGKKYNTSFKLEITVKA